MEIVIATKDHIKFAPVICETIDRSAEERGTGIAKRTSEYITTKIINGNAVIALDGDKFAGFCYIEIFSNKNYVVHSGLIVHHDYRNQGLAKKIKTKVFNYSKQKYPGAKIFGITTGLAVMIQNFGKAAKLAKIMMFYNEQVKKCACVQGCYMILKIKIKLKTMIMTQGLGVD
jgi:hypothetical protein